MSDATDFTAAFNEVKRVVQASVDPALTFGDGTTPNAAMELDAIILAAKVASTWVLNTVYAHGAVVLPTTRNGHRYRVTQGGTSGATEPTWPTGDYDVVTNGSSNPVLTFEEAGSEYANVYNIRAAVRAAWLLKAAKASQRVGFSADGRSFQAQQLFEHCERMANRYALAGVG